MAKLCWWCFENIAKERNAIACSNWEGAMNRVQKCFIIAKVFFHNQVAQWGSKHTHTHTHTHPLDQFWMHQHIFVLLSYGFKYFTISSIEILGWSKGLYSSLGSLWVCTESQDGSVTYCFSWPNEWRQTMLKVYWCMKEYVNSGHKE